MTVLPAAGSASSFRTLAEIDLLASSLPKLAAAAILPADSLSADSVDSYLLVCHARSTSLTTGVWCFSLESISGEPILHAECEEDGDLNRLSLLAAVRGLEAIDGRGMVSLISNNRYLIRSLDRSLPRWRENEFVWEQFGRRMPVQNADLWRRIDRTLAIHSVTASLLQSTRVSTVNSPVADLSLGRDLSAGRRAHGAPASNPAESDALVRLDAAHGVHAPAASDGLRRWLVDQHDATPVVTRRGRYRIADLADA